MVLGPTGREPAAGGPAWIGAPERRALTAPAVERAPADGRASAAVAPITDIDADPVRAAIAMLARPDAPLPPTVFSRVAPPHDGYFAAASSLGAGDAARSLGPGSGASILTLFVPTPGAGVLLLGAGALAARRRR